jgi:hypothetical protein
MDKQVKQLGIFIITFLAVGCFFSFTNIENNSIECSNKECQGQYVGAEFIHGSDIAHLLPTIVTSIFLVTCL